jgi:Holliday junction resolvase RusA-like endonuclease
MSVDTIIIRLAGVPVGKGRPRFVRATGHAFTPAKTRTYEAALRVAAGEAMEGRAPLAGAVAVRIIAAFPIPESWSKKRKQAARLGIERPTKAPDCDNIIKSLDALNEIVFRDDCQIVEAAVSKTYAEVPHLTVVVVPLAQPALATALIEEGKGAGLAGIGTAALHPRPLAS